MNPRPQGPRAAAAAVTAEQLPGDPSSRWLVVMRVGAQRRRSGNAAGGKSAWKPCLRRCSCSSCCCCLCNSYLSCGARLLGAALVLAGVVGASAPPHRPPCSQGAHLPLWRARALAARSLLPLARPCCHPLRAGRDALALFATVSVPASALAGASFEAAGDWYFVSDAGGAAAVAAGDAIVAIDSAPLPPAADAAALIAAAPAGAVVGLVRSGDAAPLREHALAGLHCARLARDDPRAPFGVSIHMDAGGRVMTGALSGAAGASGCIDAGECVAAVT